MKKATFILAAFVIAASVVSASQAAPIASDSFAISAGGNDYVPFTSILGQNPTVGASGFIDPWGNCCTGAMVPIPGGLTHELTPGETFDGQLIAFTSDDTVGAGNARNLSREINYTPSDGTYYMSVLLHKNAVTTRGDLLAGLGRSQDAETSIFGVDGTWIGFVDGGITFFRGPGAHLTQLLSAAEMNVDETYFALLQYDFSTSGSDTVTATIFDGTSEEVASQAFPGLDLDQTMGRFSVVTQDFGPIPALDEWRFGSELGDVMVQALPGDFDLDGNVDGKDFLLWQRDPSIGSLADWEANYGTVATVSAASAAVPEPTTCTLALATLCLAMSRRRIATR